MTSGPVVVSVLEGENAVLKNRELMGATNQKRLKLEQLEQILQRVLMQMQFMGVTL